MTISDSLQIHASPATLWAIYAAVGDWPAWDPDLLGAGIDGPFAVGSTGWIKPVDAPRMKTRILSLVAAQSFTAEARLPLCRMEFTHSVRPVARAPDASVLVTHGVDFHGPLAPLFRRMLRRKISDSLPSALQGLKRYAETRPSA